jgi:hypothetical protein
VTTEAAALMKAHVVHVQPVLKTSGYRKRGNAFNRSTEPGVVHVIHFQMGAFDPPGTIEIPGLRPNLYGLFIVNLGVFVEDAWRLEKIRFTSDGPPSAKAFINEYDCQIRHRLADDDGSSPPAWWQLSDPTAGSRLADRLETEVLPWFDGLSSKATILEALESAPPDSRAVSGVGGPDRLLATRMRLGLGDKVVAQRDFTDWVRVCRAEAVHEPHVRGHLEFLLGFAQEHSLDVVD